MNAIGSRWRTLPRVAALLCAASALLAVAIVILRLLAGTGPTGSQSGYWPFNIVVALVFPLAGLAILRRQPGHILGWLFIAGGVGNGLTGAGALYATLALSSRHGQLSGGAFGYWLSSFAWIPIPVGMVFTIAVFPDGRPVTPRWRPLLWLIAVAGSGWIFGAATAPYAAGGTPPWLRSDHPLQVAGGAALLSISLILILAGLAGAAVSLLLRFRRSRGEERQQLKWLGLAAPPLAATFVAFPLGDAGGALVSMAAVTLFITPIALAILRYRLYDVDIVVNRAFVYGALSVLVAVSYLGLVISLGHILSTERSQAVSVGATVGAALVALLLRQVVQRAVDRLMYGRRREPLRVIGALGRRLALTGTAESQLNDAIAEIGALMRLGGAAITVDGEVVAGQRVTTPGSVRLALVHQGEAIGALEVGARRGERLISRDQALLEDLCPQLAVAVHALRLTRDLHRSRERSVVALEDERRRLRRNLHDGLGPMLTSIALRADAARNMLNRNPDAADNLLVELRGELTSAIADVRRVVYGLRPPALDDLGLVGALRQQAAQLASPESAVDRDSMTVEVQAPDDLSALPAAVEVAAYRIVVEAVSNAFRHARATRCAVRISLDRALDLDVVDDGAGWREDAIVGVGVLSMRERAAELGGSLSIAQAPSGGSHVHARLPVVNGSVVP